MKITKIECISIGIPFYKPYITAHRTYTSERAIVRVYTDEEIIGVGESMTFPPYGETLDTVLTCVNKNFSEVLLGRDPFDIEENVERMDKAILGHHMAKDAVVTALYDIMGKALDLPIHKLIGGCYHEKIPIAWCIPLTSVEEAVSEAIEWTKRGFKAIKFKTMDYLGKDIDLKKLKAIRDAVGPNVSLRVDANETYPKIKTLREMEKYGLDIIEQPASITDLDGMGRYAKALDTPILVDESIFGLHDAFRVIEKQVADIVAVKNYMVGGFYKAKQLLSMLKVFDIPCYMEGPIVTSVGTMSCLQLACSSTNRAFFGCLPGPFLLKGDITKERPKFENGFLHVPKKAGLGITLDEDKLNRLIIKAT